MSQRDDGRGDEAEFKKGVEEFVKKADARPPRGQLSPELKAFMDESWERNKEAYRHLKDH